MDILIAAGSSMPNAPTGQVTLFINTEDNNILSYINDAGVIFRYNAGDSSMLDCCSCEIAKQMAEAIACSLKSGMITATEAGDLITLGFSVSTTESDDGQGNKTCTVNYGASQGNIPPVSLAIFPLTDAFILPPIPPNPTQQYIPIFTPLNTTDQSVIWVSSNPAVATIDAAGLMSVVGIGTTTIYVYSVANPLIFASLPITVS
jgi:hypothetical protein